MIMAPGRSLSVWMALRRTSSECVDDRSRPGYAEVRQVGEKVFGSGDVLVMPAGMIHSVRNESDQVTLSLHVYCKHVNFTKRSQFDPNKRTEPPFIVKLA